MTTVDLLSREVYTYAQIDDLLGLRTSTARGWIDGYTRAGRTYPPVIRATATGSDVATWGEFVECRFLAEYREAGVPLVRMRPVVDKLRKRLNTRYPLASSQLWLEPQGRELVARVQSEVDLEPPLLLVRTDEHQLPLDWTSPSQRFQESIDWSMPTDGGSAQPRRLWVAGTDRQVVIDPLRAFGEPVVRGVETAVLAELVRAGDPVSMVAELYDLTENQVAAAVQFEQRRAA